MRRSARLVVSSSIPAALSACAPLPADRRPPPPPGLPAAVERVSDHARCPSPEPWADHLTESAASRGVDVSLQPTPQPRYFHGFQTGVVAEDLDEDDDIDLLFWDGAEGLHLLLNDGAGDFSRAPLPPAPERREGQYLRVAAAGDVDGDTLPDLVWAGDGIAAWASNLGGGTFAPWRVLISEEGPTLSGYAAASFGDLEGDGDLDVVLAGLDLRTVGAPLPTDPAHWTPSADRLLLNVDGALTPGAELVQEGGANLSLVQTFTDRDLDGDVDLISWADRADALRRYPAAAFWRNDRGVLVNDAPELRADTDASAMGAATGDLNEDGQPDYCVTDIKDRLTCLLSDGGGAYYEAGAALGLVVDRPRHPAWPGPDEGRDVFTGWGIELVDLDNDGHEDVAVTGSPVSILLDLAQPDVSAFQPHWA